MSMLIRYMILAATVVSAGFVGVKLYQHFVAAKAYKTALPFYRESDRFIVSCMEDDRASVDEIVKENEQLLKQLSHDFKHDYNKKVVLNVYPSLASLHEGINQPGSPDWVVGFDDGNIVHRVSPRNPGPEHTHDSIMRSIKVGVVSVLINDKYPHHLSIPRWLHQGVALYKADYCSPEVIAKLKQDPASLPTIEQLEAIRKADVVEFNKVKGFPVSCSLISFIDHKWGWDSILSLFADYSKFEDILGVNKKEFRDQWIESLNKS